MAFWTDINSKEPLRQNKWYILFGTNLDNTRYALKECKKPEYEVSYTEHRLLTHYFKYPGLLKWKPIEIKYVSAREVPGYINLMTNYSGYNLPNIGHQMINKQSFEQNIGNPINLIQVNANGEDIETWSIYNPLISNVSYGTLSYENDAFVEVSFTLQYDWAQKDFDAEADDEQVIKNPGFPST